jgi:hypothetical protein
VCINLRTRVDISREKTLTFVIVDMMTMTDINRGPRRRLHDRLAELAAEIEALGSELDRETRREVARQMQQLIAAKGANRRVNRVPRALPEEAEAIVRKWLDDNERTVAWLHRQTGYTEQHLGLVLQGHRPITLPVAQAIERVTGIPADVLFASELAEGVA